MTQALGGGLRARANADYVSDIAPEQLYQQNIYRATRSTRSFGGNVTGSWSQVVVSGTFDRTDVFYPDGVVHHLRRTAAHQLQPRRAAHRQVAVLLRRRRRVRHDAPQHDQRRRRDRPAHDQGLTRIDVAPTVRIPFTKWPFLTVNSTFGWRGTYWTESLVDGEQVPESINRQYFDFTSRITGPVFSRIFNAGATEGVKLKHVIEPVFTIRRVSAIDVFDQIVRLEAIRLHRRRRLAAQLRPEQPAATRSGPSSREVLSVAVNQSYYTDATAAQYDQQYQSSSYADRHEQVHRRWHSSPAPRRPSGCRATSAPSGTPRSTRSRRSPPTAPSTAATCRRRPAGAAGGIIPGLPGFDNENFADHYLNASANWHTRTNTLGDHLLVQLRPEARSLPAAALPGVLQCAVLRLRRRVSDVQLRELQHAWPSRRIAASTSRSRWPESARSRISSARSAGRRALEPIHDTSHAERARPHSRDTMTR